jgi:hypothetical protein
VLIMIMNRNSDELQVQTLITFHPVTQMTYGINAEVKSQNQMLDGMVRPSLR